MFYQSLHKAQCNGDGMRRNDSRQRRFDEADREERGCVYLWMRVLGSDEGVMSQSASLLLYLFVTSQKQGFQLCYSSKRD